MANVLFDPLTPRTPRSYTPVSTRPRGIVTVSLAALSSTIIPADTEASYIVAKYDLSIVDNITTIVPYQNFPTIIGGCPVISFVGSQNRTDRYKLRDDDLQLAADLYTGQTIRNHLPTIEIWSIGTTPITVATFELQVGILLNTHSDSVYYTIQPCIVTGSGSTFPPYFTTCTF